MLVTDRCRLREFKEEDLEPLMEYRNDDDWMRFQSFKNLTKEEYRKALLVPLNIENGMQLAIADKETDILLGDLFLKKEKDTISLGYSINRTHARKKYITEVMEALLPKLQENYSGCKIIAMTDRENIPSKKLLHKLGFVYEKWIKEWETEVYVYLGKTN